jgi:PAS domain S-box-containing protein
MVLALVFTLDRGRLTKDATDTLNRPMETKPIKVLLVEDSAADARLLRELLKEVPTIEFELTTVSRLGDALRLVPSQPFDVILTDLSLPDSNGLEAFRALHGAAVTAPVVVLSGVDDETLALNAVREGAQDYLVKSRLDPHLLWRTIRYAMERHGAEQALQESERHYKHLLESITDYTYTVKLKDGQPVQALHGPGCVAVTGYKPSDYHNDSGLWHRMVPEEDRPAVLQQVSRVIAGETPPPVEHRILHQDGHIRWVRSTVVPGRDEQARLISYDGLVSDITERKKAEEKLVSSEAFYHSLVEHLPQNMFRKNLSEQFTFANQRFCQLLGKPLQEIIGKTDWDFYPSELAAKYQKDDRAVIRTGRIFETIEENVGPDGGTIYVQVVKTPIRDAKGQILGTQCIFWDITERKRFEEQLQQKNRELAASEAALRRSHEELKAAQLQLIQAEKMESIGTLAAGVAHEVKNPLAILQMGVNYITKKVTPADENMTMVLQEMKEAITRADLITRGLLDFAASKQLTVRLLNFNQLIEETLKMVRHELNKKGIKLIQELREPLPRVAVDKTQIQQVFVNVFVNAIHAMPEGGTLSIRSYAKQLTETAHNEGSRKAGHLWVGDTAVVAEVEDTGAGIPQELLSKIFDPFFTTKPTGVGTGLGLPVSRKIIELHGGTIDIKNKPQGGGVRVVILLKAHKD